MLPYALVTLVIGDNEEQQERTAAAAPVVCGRVAYNSLGELRPPTEG